MSIPMFFPPEQQQHERANSKGRKTFNNDHANLNTNESHWEAQSTQNPKWIKKEGFYFFLLCELPISCVCTWENLNFFEKKKKAFHFQLPIDNVPKKQKQRLWGKGKIFPQSAVDWRERDGNIFMSAPLEESYDSTAVSKAFLWNWKMQIIPTIVCTHPPATKIICILTHYGRLTSAPLEIFYFFLSFFALNFPSF